MLETNNAVLDVAFLHASPLIYSEDGVIKCPAQLDFPTEENNIKQALYDSNKAIKFKSQVATLDNLVEMLKNEPRILQISCHGL